MYQRYSSYDGYPIQEKEGPEGYGRKTSKLRPNATKTLNQEDWVPACNRLRLLDVQRFCILIVGLGSVVYGLLLT
jgi:hypothetical protein